MSPADCVAVASALALADRYIQSKEMASAAEEYYLNLSAGISLAYRHVWEQEIVRAENSRFTNASAMDVLAARTDSAGDKAGGSSRPKTSLLDDAINLALDIEEKQLRKSIVRHLYMVESIF